MPESIKWGNTNPYHRADVRIGDNLHKGEKSVHPVGARECIRHCDCHHECYCDHAAINYDCYMSISPLMLLRECTLISSGSRVLISDVSLDPDIF